MTYIIILVHHSLCNLSISDEPYVLAWEWHIYTSCIQAHIGHVFNRTDAVQEFFHLFSTSKKAFCWKFFWYWQGSGHVVLLWTKIVQWKLPFLWVLLSWKVIF